MKRRDEVVYVIEREKSYVIEQSVTFFFGIVAVRHCLIIQTLFQGFACVILDFLCNPFFHIQLQCFLFVSHWQILLHVLLV